MQTKDFLEVRMRRI